MISGAPASLRVAVLAATASLLTFAKRCTGLPGRRLRCAEVLPSSAPRADFRKALISSRTGARKLGVSE